MVAIALRDVAGFFMGESGWVDVVRRGDILRGWFASTRQKGDILSLHRSLGVKSKMNH